MAVRVRTILAPWALIVDARLEGLELGRRRDLGRRERSRHRERERERCEDDAYAETIWIAGGADFGTSRFDFGPGTVPPKSA